MKISTLLLAASPLLGLNNAAAEALTYQVEVVYWDDTVFRGTFEYDANTQQVSHLKGMLDDTLMGNVEPITYQLQAHSDNKGGITAYAYTMNTTEISTNPPVNNNVMVAINFNATDPILGPTDMDQLAYMDCSAGGLMGNTCMYHLANHDPVFPMEGGHGQLFATISRTDSPMSSRYDCLFNWAEANYATLFAPAMANSQTNIPPYYYRHYMDTHAYLGVNTENSHVYYVGADGALLDVGHLNDWLPLAGCQ